LWSPFSFWSARLIFWWKAAVPNPSGPGWTAKELALLGTAPDAEAAARIGRKEGAVTLKRCRLRIPTARDRRKPENR
jgi:hypothetical protein